MKPLLPFFLLLSVCCNAQLDDKSIHDLKSGRVHNDESYIYRLPVGKGKKCFLIQAYNSKMSHKNELSLDFKMKTGTKIFAARDGVVEQVKEDSEAGGLKDEYLSQGNHVIIRHNDGSMAMYWHLQKDGAIVNTGDTVAKGQWIGLSGNTGYTAFPHLHFEVKDKTGKELPTRFYTKKGAIYLRPAHWYRCVQD
jgi:murein DD-endopeptidase MepM/ murein hydrolase activator NlpD